MRIFLVSWGHEDEGLGKVAYDLQNDGHEIKYWIRTDKHYKIDKSLYPNTIFHDYFRALRNKPSEKVDSNAFEPVGEDIIDMLEESYPDFSILLMRDFPGLSALERRSIYFEMLNYWWGMIERTNPELVLFGDKPHRFFEYLIFIIAKKKGIPTLYFEDTFFSTRTGPKSDVHQTILGLEQEMEDTVGQEYNLSVLPDNLVKMFNQLRNKYEGTGMPVTVVFEENEYSIKTLFKRTLRQGFKNPRMFLAFIKKVILTIVSKIKYNLKKEYQKLQSEPDLNKKYIYVALHYQPEASTCPCGGAFSEQIQMIRILSASLPEDWCIYVKEHPAQWLKDGVFFQEHRFRGYYEQIAKIKKVKLVPVEFCPLKLMENSRAISTVTGTIGVEAMVNLKPSIIFGSAWYEDCPGVFKVKNVSSCKDVIRKIAEGYQARESEVIRFLHCFNKVSLHARMTPLANQLDPVDSEINGKRIKEYIDKYISSLESTNSDLIK